MITRVRVKNFRSLADVDVTLGPLTVLVGRNGAGKSAFVDALCFMRDSLRSGIDEALRTRNGLGMIRTRTSNHSLPEMSFHVWIEARDFKAEYGFSIASEEGGGYFISHEFAATESASGKYETLFEIENKAWKTAPPNIFAPDALERMNGFKFDPNALFLPAVSGAMPDAAFLLHFLRSSDFYGIFPTAALRTPQARQHWFPLFKDGANLASVLWELQANSILSIPVAALRSAITDIADVRVEETGGYLFVKILHKGTDRANASEWFDIAQESEGTIHLLAVLTALYQSLLHQRGLFSVVGIEEPEIALYPAATMVLGDIVKESSCRSQVLITTQSPDFISEFAADTLRVVEKVNGATHIGKLDEVQLSIIHDQLFTTGDLLRIEGLRSLPSEPVSIEDA